MSPRLDDVFRHQYTRLLSFIRRRIDDAEEAEDMLQDLFARAAENMNALSPVENLAGWMWTAARNRIIDYYRSRETRRKNEIRRTGGDEDLFDLDFIADVRIPGAENAFLRHTIIDALYESLNELPAKQREVFLLQAVDGRTFAEISELTGDSINTLTARKRYAVKFLRQRLAVLKGLLGEMQ